MDGRCERGVDAGPPTDAPPTTDVETPPDAPTCASAIFCGSPPVCCETGTECVSGACLPECASGVRCGADATCCGDGQVCVSGACTDPGDECVDSFDCPEDTFCEPTLDRCLPQFEPVTCEREPVFGAFETTLEWSFESAPDARPDCMHAISSAVVIDLDGDGQPELLTNMACDDSWERGVLRALRGDTGELLWTTSVETYGRISAAAADLRGDGNVVAITMTSASGTDPNRAIAFDADGFELWRSFDADGNAVRIAGGNNAPTIADLNGDGVSEVIWGAVVLDADGRLLWQRDRGGNEGTNSTYTGGIAAVADVDLDGTPDVVTGHRAYDHEGGETWHNDTIPDGYPAIAQFDEDAPPEVALVASGNVYLLDGMTGAVQWGPVAIPGGGIGGPPTIADFDGDGQPEIGVAGANSYSVYDPTGDADVLWSQPTLDASSNATGSSVFDFEGDGSAEVVYQDECHVRVYRGTDGMVLFEEESSSATIHEYPLVVDIDADGNSEIVAVANNRSPSLLGQCRDSAGADWDGGRAGVFVYGDARDQWVRTRRIWNQHAYHVTNVRADGTVPDVEPDNWTTPGLNNYRQNAQGEGVFNAPDLELGLEVALMGCPSMVQLRARVRNVGNLGVAAGVPVSFYRGSVASPGELLGTVTTAVDLLPGASTVVTLDAPIEGLGPFEFHAVADDDGTGAGGAGLVEECDEDNNAGGIADVDCNLLI